MLCGRDLEKVSSIRAIGKTSRAGALLAANYVVMLIGLIAGYLISTNLGSNYYGLFGKTKAVFASYSVLASGTVTTAVLVAGGKRQLRKLYELSSIQLSFALIAIVLFCYSLPEELMKDSIFYSISLLCISASTYFTGILILRSLYLAQAISLVSGSLVAFMVWYLYDINSGNFHLLIGLPSLVTITSQVIFTSINGVKFKLFMPRWSTIFWLFKLISPIILAGFLVAKSIATVYTEMNSGLEYLEISRTLLNMMLVLPTVWLQLVLPKMDNYKELKLKGIPLIYVYVTISVFLSVFVYLLSPIVFGLYQIDFHASDNILWQFLVAFPVASLGLFYANVTVFNNTTNHLLVANVLFCLGLLSLNYLLKYDNHFVGLTFIFGYTAQSIYLRFRTK